MAAESQFVGLPFRRPDRHTYEKELAEYEEADAIVVPSEFARRSFLSKGFSPDKIKKVPYGVTLHSVRRKAEPAAMTFNMLFVGNNPVRKGLHYLFEAFSRVARDTTRLKVVGTNMVEARSLLKRPDDQNQFVGRLNHTRLREVMSASHIIGVAKCRGGSWARSSRGARVRMPRYRHHAFGGGGYFF